MTFATCEATRKKLSASGRGDPAAVEHLEACGECREFAARLAAARSALRGHHAGVRADAAFSARVLQRIREERATNPIDVLGWAALRMLPAALVLTALATWSALQPHHGFASLLLPGSSDDVLASFIVSGLEEAPLAGAPEGQP